ncbi:MAG: nicotinate-nucleotide adenylyltransferase [Desulfuromonadaceae bacterium]|nr:nicotinate-nucleotide adenylyltransferase [Desulfuromonadaceae bacterium]MDD2849836.1 nicotinate-nucleotide adenylyltransferase [Desulfuromonadaceae bacterium]MDD4131607.1 nicotinate-nucleotide adenylyltransferase [Desulfuromonadaceae bacterium]
MKIGLLGGSFNPIHNAHLRIAGEAQIACLLERVIFIPAADPPHKMLEGNVSFACRSKMVSMAIAGRQNFEMSTIEGERGGKSYSIDTIQALKERLPDDELFFIIGGDSFLEIGTWHRYGEIFPLCNLIVVERPACSIRNPLEELPDAVRDLFTFDGKAGRLMHASGTTISFITGSPLELSSTEIRRLAARGADITRYVPHDVAEYISQQRIYDQCQ